MQLSPEQIVKALLNETFRSRRFVVVVFILVNAALLILGAQWPKTYTAAVGILVHETTILQPLMQSAAAPTDAMERSKTPRQAIFGRKPMDTILQERASHECSPTPSEREPIVEAIKKRTLITTTGKNSLRIE